MARASRLVIPAALSLSLVCSPIPLKSSMLNWPSPSRLLVPEGDEDFQQTHVYRLGLGAMGKMFCIQKNSIGKTWEKGDEPGI
jgi:hypothetical protein